MTRVQVTETTEEGDATNGQESEPPKEHTSLPTQPANRFMIRPEHFARAIDEQRERYAVQEEAEESITRQEAGRQRLLEMASDMDGNGARH